MSETRAVTVSSMRPGRVLVALAVVLLAAACGGGGPVEQPAPPPERVPTAAPETPPQRPTPVPDPLTASPPPGGTVVAAERVDTTGMPPGLPTLVWTRDARTLGVYGRAGGCTEARAEVLDEDDTQVVVRVEQVTTSPEPCTRELLYPALEVPLAAELGERRVVLRGEVR